MRTRQVAVAVITAATVLGMPRIAAADGGAYIELDRTHYLSGSTATGEAYVAVPEAKQHLFEDGPFYVFVLPPREWIQEGRSIPKDAIRVGTVSVAHTQGTQFELTMSFAVPDLPGDYYNVAICNDPCTIAGFKEPLTGEISIIATAREGELLTENSRLLSKTWTLRRKLRKAERTNEELEARLSDGADQVPAPSTGVDEPERELAADGAVTDRPIVDAWALLAIVGASILALLAIGLAVVFSRRAHGHAAPDPLFRLDDVEPRPQLPDRSRVLGAGASR